MPYETVGDVRQEQTSRELRSMLESSPGGHLRHML